MSLKETQLSLLDPERQQNHGVDDSNYPTTLSPLASSPQMNGAAGAEESDTKPMSAKATCPYAQALQSNTTDSTSSSSTSTPTSSPALPGLLELQYCPAFANNSCPFKDAKSSEEITKRLSRIPSSHLQGQTHDVFIKTLAFYHQNASTHSPTDDVISTAKNIINIDNGVNIGTCPVKGLVPKDWSFDRAMEDYSLAAIMSRLAQEYEDDNQPHDGAEYNDKPLFLFHQISEIPEKKLNIQKKSNEEEKKEDVAPVSITNANEEPGENNTTTSRSSDASMEASAPSTSINEHVENNHRLSDALKSGTAKAHEAAESVHFVKNFIRGQIDRELYALLVAQLFHVYRRLEKALEEHAPYHFVACHFPRELNRTEALQEDVDFWHSTSSKSNDNTSNEPPISPATQDYLNRIDNLAREDPLLLLAHAYTRYLGDLSGGKILARVARRALKLDKVGEGLAFYQFPLIESAKKFKDSYRHALNKLRLNDNQIHDIVQEANVAFLLNMRLFEELDVIGGVPGASVRDLEHVYTSSAENVDEVSMSGKQQAPCPFAKTSSAGSATTEKQYNASRSSDQTKGTCPWPFILLHDPRTGMRRWQTWLVIGLVLVLFYQRSAFGELSSIITHNQKMTGTSIDEIEQDQTSPIPSQVSGPKFLSYSQLYENWQKKII